MREKIKDLINLAIAAPSGDNCQPWRFCVKEDTVELHNAPDADTSYYNYLQRASLISHGAALENIAIAAPTMGMKPFIQLFPEPDNQDFVARITFEKAQSLKVELAPFIEQRVTNRKKYAGIPLNDSQLSQLIPNYANLKKVTAFLATSRSDLNEMAKVVSLNDQLVFEIQQLHEFLFEHIRWSTGEAERLRDGLDIKTLELSVMDTAGFKILRYWPFAKHAGKIGVSKLIARNARRLAESASTIGFVLGERDSDPAVYIEGGRLMQRIWLQSTKMGLAFHPMTGISFLMQRVKEHQASQMSKRHQDLVLSAVQRVASVSNVVAPSVLCIFRVGVAEQPAVRSLRKDLTDFVKSIPTHNL